MITEYKQECEICGYKGWKNNKKDECPDCFSSLDVVETRERDESNGFCSIGDSLDEGSDINCNLVATHTAATETDFQDEPHQHKLCDKHAKLWEGSDVVLQLNEI